MLEENVRFSVEGAGAAFVHPLGLTLLLLCGGLFIALPRRYALWGFVVLICFVSTRQAIAVWGFNFYFPRIMVLVFGVLVRGFIRGELLTIRFNRLDTLVVTFGCLYMVAGAIAWDFSEAVLKTRSGYITEMVGMYFVCRMLIRDIDDVHVLMRGLAVVGVLLLGFFVFERGTGRNLFATFGGVPEITQERGGRLRCQGAFGHPILAGVFWAALLPLFWSFSRTVHTSRFLFWSGGAAACGIVVLCASSTPLLGAATAIVGCMLFPFRHHARQVFAAFGLCIISLHLMMEAPVWALIQRVNLTPGNSGYHRYLLVDSFIRNLHEWWLLGSNVGTSHWGHFTYDTANQFVNVGVSAGLIGLGVFLAITVVALFACGRVARYAPEVGWGVGVSIFALSVSFLGISIWGQLHFVWALPVAVAGSLGFGDSVVSRSAAISSAQRTPRSRRAEIGQTDSCRA